MTITPAFRGVVESPLVEMATAAEAAAGSIKLCYGEPDLPTPAFIVEAAAAAARDGHTFYTHTAGTPGLRAAIAAQVHALHGVDYRPEEIIATVGASMAIYAAIRALVGPGDNAVIISPAYAIFQNDVILAGGEPRLVPLVRAGRRFRLDLDRLARAFDARSRLLIVNSPSNPTGWMASDEEQRALVELADARGVTILADEVYERLTYDDRRVAPSLARLVRDRRRLIVVNSFSKTYNMTGWRLGWAQAEAATIRAMYRAVEFMTSNPTAFVQQAGIAALREGEPHVAGLRAHYAARRRDVLEALAALPGFTVAEPAGAFYVFARVDQAADSAAWTRRLLERAGVALAPGTAFGPGGEGSIRLCFASTEATIREALARLAAFSASAQGA